MYGEISIFYSLTKGCLHRLYKIKFRDPLYTTAETQKSLAILPCDLSLITMHISD